MRYRVVVWLVLSGCAGAIPQTELTALKQKLQESERRTAQAEQKLDDLESKVFLLTDQVESQKVAAIHREPPKLPVIRLAPQPEPAVERVADATDGDAEFSGDARTRVTRMDSPRPVLRIEGEQQGTTTITPTTTATQTATITPRKHHTRNEARNVVARNDAARNDVRVQRDDDAPARDAGDVKSSDNLGVAAAPLVDRIVKGGTSPAKVSKESGDPLKLYADAYHSLKAGHHDEAAEAFRQFVRRFPNHDYADNAQYWLGESFYDQKRYAEAAAAFRVVVERYPTGNKAPDALLKLSYCLLQSGEHGQGVSLLKLVSTSYPLTDAARLAEERLQEMSKESKAGAK